jgi:hypothetical protein
MATPLFFNTTTDGAGITYYIIPAGTPLFRGDVPPNSNSPLEHINGPVFFGQTADVALIYGIPFEFVTNSEHRLLALDKSMKKIYENALADSSRIDGERVMDVIPKILKRNYGYNDGVRNSDDAADKKLTNYICKNFPGYATDFMETDFGGDFHREIVICDKNSVNFVQKLTEVNGFPVNEQTIRDEQELRKVAREDASKRAQKKQRTNMYPIAIPQPSSAKKLSFGDSDSDEEGGPIVYPNALPPPSYVKKLSFGDSDEEGGGKSRKRIKSHKKQMRNKRRKTHKKSKPKKATQKRK